MRGGNLLCLRLMNGAVCSPGLETSIGESLGDIGGTERTELMNKSLLLV